jgi:two-component sensor histidine kinase
VKNNLQIVASLLNWQIARTEDTQVRELLGDSRGRIRSMALVHERLHESSGAATVDFDAYVRSLTRNLFRTHITHPGTVLLKLDVEPITLDIDRAVPCGLIVNELVSNALKHAFPNNREGEITVRLRAQDGTIALSVRDDGIGLPANVDLRNPKSVGLELVQTLVHHLGAMIALEREGGTSYRITFPEEEPTYRG